MHKAPMMLAAVAVLTAAMPAMADVKGKVALREISFTVADAVAYKTDDGVDVALLPAAFDRKAAAKDRKIDTFDVMRMGQGYVALRLETGKPFSCIDFSVGGGGGSSCNSDYATALKLTVNTAERVAGTFRLKGPAGTSDVTFDLKVESVVVPPGTPLPADGGDPGKAVMAHFAAIEKNDFKALKATASPDQAKQMEASEKSGEAKEMFKMMRAMSPRKVKITGGTVDGDDALVDFEAVEDGKPVKGVAECVRIAGKWYMSGSNTRH
jgi:hypothetical protein